MNGHKSEFQEIVRKTLEYHEARALLAEKAKLRAEVARINTELRQLRKLSPEAIVLAKADVQAGEDA